MEAVRLLQLLQTILSLLLEMQPDNNQHIQNTRSQQNSHRLQNGPAGCYEELHAPVRGFVSQDNHHLRVGDDQQPVPGLSSIAGRHFINKIGSTAKTENGVRELEGKVGALRQLGSAAKASGAVLGDCEIGNSRAGQVRAIRERACISSTSQYHNLEQRRTIQLKYFY